MTRSDWCAHGHHDACRVTPTADGRAVRCGCGCHDDNEEED
ncbi:MAG TPA: hypothetical protein VFJ14_06740 [Nocardioidaceae bacterium]|nr:hypothetical protein [Nocardioidaceae bacterium]